MIKIITGVRRSGKSFLLFDLFADWLAAEDISSEHIIKFDLENRRNKYLRNPDNLLEFIDAKQCAAGRTMHDSPGARAAALLSFGHTSRRFSSPRGIDTGYALLNTRLHRLFPLRPLIDRLPRSPLVGTPFASRSHRTVPRNCIWNIKCNHFEILRQEPLVFPCKVTSEVGNSKPAYIISRDPPQILLRTIWVSRLMIPASCLLYPFVPAWYGGQEKRPSLPKLLKRA